MIATDAGVRLAVGLPGHGKTYGIRQDVFAFARAHPVIVLDLTHEWARPPGSLMPRDVLDVAARASSVGEAAAMIDAGKRLVVVSTLEDPEVVADAALKWAVNRPGRAGVAIPEAHGAFPVHKPLSRWARTATSAWRHFDVALWVDTQRLSFINRAFDMSQQIRVYSATAADDERLRAIGKEPLIAAVRECGTRNAPKEHGGRGEPGWHVALYAGVRPKAYHPTRAT